METTTSIQHEIENGCHAFEAAFARQDAAALADLYTADGQLLPAGIDVVTGRSAIADFWSGIFRMGITGAELKTVEVHACGDLAVEGGRYVLKAPGGQVADQGKYIVVWKHAGDAWKLHRDIWTTNLAPAG